MTVAVLAGCHSSPRAANPSPIPQAGLGLGPVVLPISGPVPGAPGALVYAVPGGLWVLEPSTKNKRVLLPLPQGTLPTHPAASSDGKLIAFGLYRPAPDPRTPGGTDLQVVNRDGSGLRVVLAHDEPLSYASEPAWAPDGRSLYYTYRSSAGATRLERINLDGSGRTSVLDRGEHPSVSPDGKRLVFVRNEPPSYIQSIWVAAADGSGARRLLDGADFDSLAMPRFSRDGDRFVFAAVGGPGIGIPPQACSTGTPACVPGRGLQACSTGTPACVQGRGLFVEARETNRGRPSPAFESLRQRHLPHGVPWDIWLMKGDGSDLRRVTELGEDTPIPVWSPDGRWIAFSGELGIYLMTAEGKDLVRLSDEWVAGGLTWLP